MEQSAFVVISVELINGEQERRYGFFLLMRRGGACAACENAPFPVTLYLLMRHSRRVFFLKKSKNTLLENLNTQKLNLFARQSGMC